MRQRWFRSNCQTLFGMLGIPSDGPIRNLLGRLVPDSFQSLFMHLLDTLHSKGDIAPFVRLANRMLVAQSLGKHTRASSAPVGAFRCQSLNDYTSESGLTMNPDTRKAIVSPVRIGEAPDRASRYAFQHSSNLPRNPRSPAPRESVLPQQPCGVPQYQNSCLKRERAFASL